jgi:hypothetical protein
VSKLILESQRAIDIINGEITDDSEYVLVNSEYAGEWRWGVSYEVVIKDSEGKLWGTTYNQQSGDHYYNSLEDGPVHFYPVEAIEKTVIEYRRIRQ